MLSNAGLHRRFWAETASTGCYLINRSPSIALNKKTPIEVWSGSPADYSQLRVFGCTAYAHVDNGKLEQWVVKFIFLGYKSGVKGFKLWNPETQKVVISRNVIFNESAMLHDVSSTNVPVGSEQRPILQEPTVQVEHVIDSGDISDNVDAHDDHVVDDEHVIPIPN